MEKKHPSGFVQLVNDSKTRVKEVDVPTVNQYIKENKDFYLIDVREDREWINGSLPNAIHLSKGVIERDIEKAIPNKESLCVLFCGGGFRSALAADNIQKMGYTNVLSMQGGFRGWVDAGLPIQET